MIIPYIKGLCNAFSLQMLSDLSVSIKIQPIENRYDFNLSDIPSFIGHQDTANVLGVAMNRANISLDKGDSIIVAQLMGGRLPEGSVTLPDGFYFKYILVTVLHHQPYGDDCRNN